MPPLVQGPRTSCSPPTATAPARASRWSGRSVTPTHAALASWAGATAHWPGRDRARRHLRAQTDYLTRDFTNNIGAEIMGRNKFGPQRGPWEDHDWQGWWGDVPPFHTPVFVLTHHPRPSFTLDDTTFHFVDASPAEALALAVEAADGPRRPDRRRGRRPSASSSTPTSSTRCTSPSPRWRIGRGERLWVSSDELLDRFHREEVPSPSGVTHLLFWRRWSSTPTGQRFRTSYVRPGRTCRLCADRGRSGGWAAHPPHGLGRHPE